VKRGRIPASIVKGNGPSSPRGSGAQSPGNLKAATKNFIEANKAVKNFAPPARSPPSRAAIERPSNSSVLRSPSKLSTVKNYNSKTEAVSSAFENVDPIYKNKDPIECSFKIREEKAGSIISVVKTKKE
jgi:hypothetical protein